MQISQEKSTFKKGMKVETRQRSFIPMQNMFLFAEFMQLKRDKQWLKQLVAEF